MNKMFNDYKLFAKDKCKVSDTNLIKYGRYINPSIVEERETNFQVMDVFSKLIMERQIFLGSEVDADVTNIINSQLLYLESIGNEDITMYINSPGGSVTDGLAIYDTMNFIDSDVSTMCLGLCASMGAVLLSSGEKGKRYALRNGSIMIHQPLTTGIKGQATDVLIEAAEMEKCRKNIYKILADNCNKTVEEIAADSERNFWLTAEEAKKYNLIDDVLFKKKKPLE